MLLRFALIAAVLSATCCDAQTGTVTFYTPANTVKSVATATVLPRSEQPFTGWLFDGSQRLVHVHAGRFVTFHLKPGAHPFTVPWHPFRPGKEPHVLNVESGHQYCIRLYAKMTNLQVFQWLNSQIDEVPCQRAQREAEHFKPIEIKRVDPAVRVELDPAATFPSESLTQR